MQEWDGTGIKVDSERITEVGEDISPGCFFSFLCGFPERVFFLMTLVCNKGNQTFAQFSLLQSKCLWDFFFVWPLILLLRYSRLDFYNISSQLWYVKDVTGFFSTYDNSIGQILHPFDDAEWANISRANPLSLSKNSITLHVGDNLTNT